MNFVEQLTAVTLLVDFFLGVAFGVVSGAVYGSRREDSSNSLLGPAPDDLSAGARIIHGLYSRDDGYMQSLLPGDSQVSGDETGKRRTDESGATGKEPRR